MIREAGIRSGMEKAAYGYGYGQATSHYDQPQPPQTQEQHRKKTLRKAVGLGLGLAAAGVGIAKRKQIGDFAKNMAKKYQNRGLKRLPGKVAPSTPKAPKPDGSYSAKGMGQAPTGQLKADVAKEFKAMGMSPPPDAPKVPDKKQGPGWKKKLKRGAAVAGGAALAAPVIAAGLHKGSREQFIRKAHQEQDDYTPGMSGAYRG